MTIQTPIALTGKVRAHEEIDLDDSYILGDTAIVALIDVDVFEGKLEPSSNDPYATGQWGTSVTVQLKGLRFAEGGREVGPEEAEQLLGSDMMRRIREIVTDAAKQKHGDTEYCG